MKAIYQQEIIDTHIHFWDLKKFSYNWIEENSNNNLKNNYLLSDFENDSKNLNIKKAVHVQAEINSDLIFEETKWLQSISDNNLKKIPNAIIGFVDLSKNDVEYAIEKHLVYDNFRGIRQILKFDPKNSKDKINLLQNNIWIKNLKILEKNNLSFDLLINYYQFNEVSKVIKMYPNLQFIVNHTLWPQGIGLENFKLWEEAINIISEHENASIKLSGFGERDSMWQKENIRPFIDYSIKKFGIKRCMFATNFPVDKAFSSNKYFNYWNTYYNLTKDFSTDEKDDLFFKNAERFYKI